MPEDKQGMVVTNLFLRPKTFFFKSLSYYYIPQKEYAPFSLKLRRLYPEVVWSSRPRAVQSVSRS